MRAPRLIRSGLIAGATALLVAACGSGHGPASSGYGGSQTPAPTARPPASANLPMVKTATAAVMGKSETVLVNGQGMTLYYYSPDKASSVTCTAPGGCAPYWSPLKAGSTVQSPIPGVSGTFSTDPDPSGGSVVTYNSWPLYTYNEDRAPGQTNGEGVMDSNRQGIEGTWHVATPSLTASSAPNSSSAPSSSPYPSPGY